MPRPDDQCMLLQWLPYVMCVFCPDRSVLLLYLMTQGLGEKLGRNRFRGENQSFVHLCIIMVLD